MKKYRIRKGSPLDRARNTCEFLLGGILMAIVIFGPIVWCVVNGIYPFVE